MEKGRLNNVIAVLKPTDLQPANPGLEPGNPPVGLIRAMVILSLPIGFCLCSSLIIFAPEIANAARAAFQFLPK